MPSQVLTNTENNFTKGLLTEFTGLNFPENAATDTDNCIYTLIGDVTRREGFDFEENYQNYTTPAADFGENAITTYRWRNASGDGDTEVLVTQVGVNLFYYISSNSTVAAPLSTTLQNTTSLLSQFTPTGLTFDPTQECQFADGNGYLFVYHPSIDPFYITYASGVFTAGQNLVQTRDFLGVPTSQPVNYRPSLAQDGPTIAYNLLNQGWNAGNGYSFSASDLDLIQTGVMTFTVASGVSGVTNGDIVNVIGTNNVLGGAPPGPGGIGVILCTGNVTSYSGTTLQLGISYVNPTYTGFTTNGVIIVPQSGGTINTWVNDIGNLPSNADVWWYYKDDTGAFNPSTTIGNVTLSNAQAPQGHFILDAFSQKRFLTSGYEVTDILSATRPRTGAWYAGRVWYAGTDYSVAANGTAPYYTWTESIYFSQVIVDDITKSGNCYQENDPTSEQLFDLLPTDGGVIVIPGCGSVYKLYPIQNGMLVFAANGIWFITGSQGIGFSADDYTVTQISHVQSISSTSFVDVNGLPIFWNEEGIYSVEPTQGGQLQVNPITVGTILTFYNNIPRTSRQYARGAYDPINYIVQWIYKSTVEEDVTSRYEFDSALSYNTYNKAFYPYSFPSVSPITGLQSPFIHSITYVTYPRVTTAPDPSFKYYTSVLLPSNNYNVTFSEEWNDGYVDWFSYDQVGVSYSSYFVTGYKVHGQGQRKFQIPYVYVISRTNGAPVGYIIQGLWDYSSSGNSGKWSSNQVININGTNFGYVYRRHRIRGHGLAMQFKVSSIQGVPFDVIGWSTFETVNAGI